MYLFQIYQIRSICMFLSAHLFHIKSFINNLSLAYLTLWYPSPYIALALANTLGKYLGYVVSILWWDQIVVDTSINMGQYHGKYLSYSNYHGVDYVRDFVSQYLRMYATLLHRTCVCFLKLSLPSIYNWIFLSMFKLVATSVSLGINMLLS